MRLKCLSALARKFFDDLGDQRAVLVGASETGSLAARHFLQHNVGSLTVVNRSCDKAVALAQTLSAAKRAGLGDHARNGAAPPALPATTDDNIVARPWTELTTALAEADVILTTTGATTPVILPAMVSPRPSTAACNSSSRRFWGGRFRP